MRCANSIDQNWGETDADVCHYLHDKRFTTYESSRAYWLAKFILVNEWEGINGLLKAIATRDYGGIWSESLALPDETWSNMFSCPLFNDDDVAWMKWLTGK